MSATEPTLDLHSRVESSCLINRQFKNSELVIGLVGPIGCELEKVRDILDNRLKLYKYSTTEIKISKDVIPLITDTSKIDLTTEYTRIKDLMEAGNAARKEFEENAILALGAAAKINQIDHPLMEMIHHFALGMLI